MTRRRVQPERPDPEGAVDLDTRQLVTVRDDQPYKHPPGTLVRYQAGPDLSAVEVERRRQQLLEWGAGAVKVERLSAEQAARSQALPDESPMEAQPSMENWQAELDRMIANVKTVDQEQLRACITEALAEGGL